MDVCCTLAPPQITFTGIHITSTQPLQTVWKMIFCYQRNHLSRTKHFNFCILATNVPIKVPLSSWNSTDAWRFGEKKKLTYKNVILIRVNIPAFSHYSVNNFTFLLFVLYVSNKRKLKKVKCVVHPILGRYFKLLFSKKNVVSHFFKRLKNHKLWMAFETALSCFIDLSLLSA